METALALWQQVGLAVLAALSLAYVLYFRIWVALAAGSDLLFLLALCLAVTSIAAPQVFARGARELLEHTPVPAALASADQRVAALETLPQQLIDRALERIGYERDRAPEQLAPREAGPFEARVRPALEALIATILRVTSLLCAMLILGIALALRASTATIRALRELARRLDRLEAEAGAGHAGAAA